MMRLSQQVLESMRNFPGWLPLEPMHDWRSAPDDGDHTHCRNCGHTIERGDPCVAKYLEYVSVTFCPACVADNPEVFCEWVDHGPSDAGQ